MDTIRFIYGASSVEATQGLTDMDQVRAASGWR
jgi:hypothetical protein